MAGQTTEWEGIIPDALPGGGAFEVAVARDRQSGLEKMAMSVQAASLTETDVDEILNDLVRETLGTLFPVMLGLAWLWLTSEIIRGSHVDEGYAALAILLVALVGGRSLGQNRLRSVVRMTSPRS